MKLMLCMLINIKVFYSLIVLFLMGLTRDVQSTQVNLQCLCDIVRKTSRIVKELLLVQIPFLQFIIHPMLSHHWPFSSIWHPYETFSSFDCLCNMSSLLVFQVMVGPCKLASFKLFVMSCYLIVNGELLKLSLKWSNGFQCITDLLQLIKFAHSVHVQILSLSHGQSLSLEIVTSKATKNNENCILNQSQFYVCTQFWSLLWRLIICASLLL